MVLAEEADGCICSRGEDPRLGRVELHIENAEVMSDHVTPEDLDWDDERVLQQVTGGRGQRVVTSTETSVARVGLWRRRRVLLVNCSVADDDGAVVRS